MDTTAKTIETSFANADDIWGGRKLIDELQTKARSVLDPLIPVGSSVALLDYPNNPNVGDSLIWLGEMAYLNSRNAVVDYVCDVRNYSSNRLSEALRKDSIILLQGGGNFGTLWPEEQEFRLRVLRDFPGKKIIQLAQSIHFENPTAIEAAAQAIRAHGNYTLLVRDQPSLNFAKAHFECNTALCPDMAFFIGSIQTALNPPLDRFILSRTDHEKSGNWLGDLSIFRQSTSFEVGDWLKASRYERLLGRIERYTSGFRKTIDPYNKGLHILWNHLAVKRLVRGRRMLEQGRVVISDRLHVHILCILLNKPHVLIDNANRKISSLHQAWTKQYQGVFFASGVKEGFDIADKFDQLADQQLQKR